MAKKITMQQIADYLGVSKYVVSKALAGKPGVNEETRKRVLDTAAQLGYVATKRTRINDVEEEGNEVPPSVSKKDKPIILVVMPNIRYQTKESAYWGKVVDGVTDALEKKGFAMVLLTESHLENIQTVIHLKNFAGVITVGVVTRNILIELNHANLPIVMIDHEDSLIRCDTIFNNNVDASFQLTNHLLGLGHKRIEFIGNVHYSRSFFDRFNGVRSALENFGGNLSFNQELIEMDPDELPDQFREWLNKHIDNLESTAFICGNDQIASQVIEEIKLRGLKVPEDISVTGFDNLELSYLSSPTITTVNVEKLELGKRAVEALLRRLSGNSAPFEKILISGTTLLRESTGPSAK